MMRRESIDAFAAQRPFQPFEVQLVDGQRFRIAAMEQFVLGRYPMAVLNAKGVIVTLSLGLISTIRPLARRRGGSGRD